MTAPRFRRGMGLVPALQAAFNWVRDEHNGDVEAAAADLRSQFQGALEQAGLMMPPAPDRKDP